MPQATFNFYLDSWADWQRTIQMTDAISGAGVLLDDAFMEIRNTNWILALRLDSENGRCVISEDRSQIFLHILAQDSLAYFAQGNYPGAVQAVGFWGIGRSYIYDLFATYHVSGVQDRILRGFFNVDPNISQPVNPSLNPALTIGQRGSYE
jgi:hypothetical protein